jgi:flavin-dependent dehydrogenase
MASSSYDVVILGGGPAGCSAAIALLRAAVGRVLLVDAAAASTEHRIGESIPPDTGLLLRRLGIFDAFSLQEHERCLGSCSSWGDAALGYNDFLFNPHGLGWHLDRARFDALLMGQVAERGGELRASTRFAAADRVDRHFDLRLVAADGSVDTLRARFVVDATGRRSQFARRVGARPVVHDRLSCVLAYMDRGARLVMPRLTVLEAVAYGWWYAARLADGRVAVAVATDPDTLREKALHQPASWLAGLRQTRHLAGLLDAATLVSNDLVACTAPSFILDCVGGDDWQAVGDAASAYDPICAQGIHKALLDGLQSAQAITAALGGDLAPLRAYRETIQDRFVDYSKNRAYFYEMEQRWPSAAFWRRRRQHASTRVVSSWNS